jgi:hypothetical protein
MPAVRTRSSGVTLRHTGAGSHLAAQADALLSLGGHVSSTLAAGMGFRIPVSPLRNLVRVDRVSHANGTGSGALTAVTASTATWTPPGGSAGAETTLTLNTSVQVEGGDTSKWIWATRKADMSEGAVLTLNLSDPLNGIVGGADVTDNSSASAKYLCLGLYAEVFVASLKVWIVTPAVRIPPLIQIAKGTVTAGEAEVTGSIDNDPGGLTWLAPYGSGGGLNFGRLYPGEWGALWIRLMTEAGEPAVASALTQLRYSFLTEI